MVRGSDCINFPGECGTDLGRDRKREGAEEDDPDPFPEERIPLTGINPYHPLHDGTVNEAPFLVAKRCSKFHIIDDGDLSCVRIERQGMSHVRAQAAALLALSFPLTLFPSLEEQEGA
jgi:hypothetical protein